MQRCRVDSVELECEEAGSGEPLLFIHGSPAATFWPVMGAGALASYRRIRYHRRNWEGSSRVEGGVRIGDHACDAARLLARLGVRHTHVVGHSYGALVALQLAVDVPDLVGSLALVEPNLLAVPSAVAFNEQVRPAFAAFRAGDHAAAVAQFFAVVAGRPWHECEALVERLPGGVDQLIADAHAFFAVDVPALGGWAFDSEVAARIGCPVLSVAGTATLPFFRDGNELLRRWFPQLEEADVPGAGHLAPLENPVGVAERLAGFFDKYPLPQGAG